MKRLDIGVFLPIAKNGFVFSTAGPPYPPSYQTNLEISLLSERIGLDFVFSMSKWRGFGGASQFWDASHESFSLMAALAAATRRIDLIATVNPLLFHPAMMAKMAATIQDVSGGRLGLNIVTGATIGEYAQMGVIPENYNEHRYAYAAEWTRVLKRLWHESSVTHHGNYFRLEDCVSEPKPNPPPFLVCAATSDEGLRFTVREADWSFMSGTDLGMVKQYAARARSIAAEEGRKVKIAIPVMLVMGDTMAAAEAYQERLFEAADLGALGNIGRALSGENRDRAQLRGAQRLADRKAIYAGLPIVGTARDVADRIIDLAEDGEADCLLLILVDYMDGLQRFGAEVMPLLKAALDVGTQDGTGAGA
ncbi:MAG: LLM class flavin-dependent oxidoreductase [Sphingomonadaceae bacterium]|nr:LLM class flavin-dependent oxidoreductase [Sphingomonadaceae bacterium]